MIVRIKGKPYDVAGRKCAVRECFWPGVDKGAYTPGVGYTSYHKKERPVCMRRHVHGCPINSVCETCRTVSVNQPGTPCEYVSSEWCKPGSLTVAREEVK